MQQSLIQLKIITQYHRIQMQTQRFQQQLTHHQRKTHKLTSPYYSCLYSWSPVSLQEPFQSSIPPLFQQAYLLIVPYLVYLVISLRCNSLLSEMKKLKKFQQYKQTYDNMVNAKPHFRFYVFCYHYDNVKTSNGSRRQMITTYTATQNYTPEIWSDESGDISGIKDIKKYVFVQYERSYYFANKESQERFKSNYKSFVQRNKRDQRQDYSHTFELPGFVEQVGFCMLGHSPHNHWLFYLFTFLGLALPYTYILEKSISRYSIKMVKRIGNSS